MLKVLVDCDPGVDDICALQFLINRKDVEIVGISIVHGNCPASVGAKNALKLLTLNNLQHKIPIFFGSDTTLVAEDEDWKRHHLYHGNNGLCDVTENDVEIDESVFLRTPAEAAPNAIVQLSQLYANELAVLAIGPLTNLALAMTIDPHCAKKWRSLTIMGGTSWGRGNVTAAAEFNFFHDPEAAATVLRKIPEELDTKIVTWEATREGTFKKEMIDFHPYQTTFKGEWLWERCKRMGVPIDEEAFDDFCICDLVAAVVLVEGKAIKSSRDCHVAVECAGKFSRGAMIVDARDRPTTKQKEEAGFKLVTVVDKVDYSRPLLDLHGLKLAST